MHNPLDDELSEVGDSSVDDLVEKHEQEQKPDLGIDKGLTDLVPLDGLVENSGSGETTAADQESALFEGESLGCEDAVGEEEEEDKTPHDRHATADEEDCFPDGKAVNLPDAEGENAADLCILSVSSN